MVLDNDDDVKKLSVDMKKCSNSKIKLQISIQPLNLLENGKSSLILIMSLLVDRDSFDSQQEVNYAWDPLCSFDRSTR